MSEGTRCTCGAGHETYGACIRAKGLHIGQVDRTEQSRWDKEISAYRDARKQGVQPMSTKLPDVQAAMELSNQTGRAFSATERGFV